MEIKKKKENQEKNFNFLRQNGHINEQSLLI